jgi:hypothetical protein
MVTENKFEDEKAKNNSLIKMFVALADATRGDGYLSFANLQTRPFMKYWKYFAICKYLEDEDDFETIFCGTELVNRLGSDQTGTKVKGKNYALTADKIFNIQKQALTEIKAIYLSGDLKHKNRDYTKWVQVKMGIKFDNAVRGTVTLLIIE